MTAITDCTDTRADLDFSCLYICQVPYTKQKTKHIKKIKIILFLKFYSIKEVAEWLALPTSDSARDSDVEMDVHEIFCKKNKKKTSKISIDLPENAEG